ncbi:DUF4240 domain-containing protein [Leptolyngbya sp. AN03gr2]|uniref:DUF4240 domain-containing protein n=1 Tax=unclassified Leptolyngbya TaxID=2650499 RepID=UPI003D31A94A
MLHSERRYAVSAFREVGAFPPTLVKSESSEAFWEFVEQCQWQDAPAEWGSGSISNSRTFAQQQIDRAVSVLNGYPIEQQMKFETQFKQHREQLRQALNELCRADEAQEVGYRLPISGDDSFDDLCAHIIGKGKTFFESVIANPESAARITHYVESFWYVFNDLPNPELEALLDFRF